VHPSPLYRLKAPGQQTDLAARIAAHLRLAEEPAERRSLTLYDTFDWAIHEDGGWLEYDCGAGGCLLRFSPRDGVAESLTQDVPEPPVFAADLPQGPVRERILGVGDIRRLLPIVRIHRQGHLLRVLDDEDKTVVRLVVQEESFEDPASGRSGELGTYLKAVPVRGYERELRRCLELLDSLPELAAARGPKYLDALTAIGRRPGDYSSKLDYQLEPGQRADAVTKIIMLGLLDTIERNIDGTRQNLDSEFLHDLRVAVRRTRSALTQIKGVFPDAVVDEYKERFAWLQQVTGLVRDLDVYLLDFQDYQQSLPAPLRPHLEPMRDHVLAHYDEEQARLARVLGSGQFRSLLQDWRAFLESPVPHAPLAPNALLPIKAVADARIRRMAKRVRKEGKAINPQSPAEELHELRKSCKKLRYLMEFFQSLYPKDDIRVLIRLMKTLLDNLGNFQDLAVQAVHLCEMAEVMRQEGRADTDTLLSIGALVADLLNRQQQARQTFSRVFAQFMADEPQSAFRTLFRGDAEALEAGR
jgi:CHAD domain-containing protein